MKEKMSKGGSLADEIKSCFALGKLVSSELVVQLLKEHIKGKVGTTFLVDGFPKSSENLDVWNKHMLYECNTLCLLLLECEQDVMFQRLQ